MDLIPLVLLGLCGLVAALVLVGLLGALWRRHLRLAGPAGLFAALMCVIVAGAVVTLLREL